MISKTVDKDFFRYECNYCKNAWKSRPYQFKDFIDQPLKCPKCGSRYWCIKAKLNPKEEDDMEVIIKKPLALEEIQARRKAYSKAYREAHREQRKAYNKAYREAHREQIKAYHKAYREAHREQRKAYSKAYYEAHREQRKAYSKAYYEARREKRALTIGFGT